MFGASFEGQIIAHIDPYFKPIIGLIKGLRSTVFPIYYVMDPKEAKEMAEKQDNLFRNGHKDQAEEINHRLPPISMQSQHSFQDIL